MIKILRLQKAVYAIILGILALVAARIMYHNEVAGSGFVLGASGVLLIFGALLLIYPILFAKKVDAESEKVELKPVSKESISEDSVS